MSCVYFIQKGYGSVKIGVAEDPERRLRELQTGNHGRLHLIAKLPCPSRAAAFALERQMHERFASDRLQGEWFHKRILRKFKERAQMFPQIFCGGPINSYRGMERLNPSERGRE